jgi:hypothetical protein
VLRTVPTVAALASTIVLLSGCGGGKQSCTIYDRASNLYVVLRAPGTKQQAGRACARLNQGLRTQDATFSTLKGNRDYSTDIRVCAFRGSGAEMDVYDTRTDPRGRALCKILRGGLQYF